MNLRKIIINIIIAVVVSLSVINIVGIFFAKENPYKALISYPFKYVPVFLVILALDYLAHAIRTMIVVKSMGYKITFFQALENVFFNIYFSFVTPMSIGGQPFQIYHLTRLGLSTYDATNITISRMFVGIMIVFTVDIIFINKVIGILRGTVGLGVVLLGFFVTTAISILGFIAFTNKKFLFSIFRLIRKITRSEKLKNKEEAALKWIENMSDSTKTLFLKNYWALILDWLLGVIASVASPLLLKLSIEAVTTIRIPLSIIWGTLTMLNTVVYYVPTPGSSGSIEGFYQLVLSHMYDSKSSMVGILMFRIITYYLIVFLGTVLIWRVARYKDEMMNDSSTNLTDDSINTTGNQGGKKDE